MQPSTPARHSAPDLPTRPNLEHLRKEAKSLLKELRRSNLGTPLAEAQLVVARRYGFPSWRKLKSYIDAFRTNGASLIDAVRKGDIARISEILELCPELVDLPVDLEEQGLRPSDALAMRLIHVAVAEGHREVVQLLISKCANLNLRNADGRLPLHDCFELGRDGLAKSLLSAGAEPDICIAAAYGLHEKLEELLNRDPCQANDLRTGLSPIGWCVYGNQIESATILLNHGAVVNRAPLNLLAWGPAAHVASVRFAKLLLESGADPNCPHQSSVLPGAVGRVDGDTPLHMAIKSRIVADPTEFVRTLLSGGADPTIRNSEGRTPLDEARLQVGNIAETYFPAKPTRPKNMEPVIELLTAALGCATNRTSTKG